MPSPPLRFVSTRHESPTVRGQPPRPRRRSRRRRCCTGPPPASNPPTWLVRRSRRPPRRSCGVPPLPEPGRPVQHGAYAQYQFSRAERFADVVVRTRLQTVDPIGFLGARGQYQDRHVRRSRNSVATASPPMSGKPRSKMTKPGFAAAASVNASAPCRPSAPTGRPAPDTRAARRAACVHLRRQGPLPPTPLLPAARQRPQLSAGSRAPPRPRRPLHVVSTRWTRHAETTVMPSVKEVG